eukprot:scaffold25077_cov69-Skeletonema_menzelii.AAC.1
MADHPPEEEVPFVDYEGEEEEDDHHEEEEPAIIAVAVANGVDPHQVAIAAGAGDSETEDDDDDDDDNEGPQPPVGNSEANGVSAANGEINEE